MEVHTLAPTMEDAEDAEFHSETFGRGEEERLGGGAEEDSVDDFFVVEGKSREALGTLDAEVSAKKGEPCGR